VSTFKVAIASLKMALATFLSRIMGLVREQLMAHFFGASGLTDAFLVAYRIPNLLRDLLAEGAFSSAFVPTFVKENQKDHEKGRELLWELFILLGSLTAILSLLIALFADPLIRIFAPSFVLDPEKFSITVSLTRIMSPFLFFISIAALFMGALNSLRVFFIPSLAPAFYNLMSIFSMLFLTGWLMDSGYQPILALGWGACLGGFMQAIVQIPMLIKKGYQPKKILKLGSEPAKKVIKLLGPGMVGFAATQINLLINTILATGSVVGATSWLNYSFRLFQLPVGILSVSIGNSNLVHFSSAWKDGKKQEAISFLSSSLFLSYVTVLPAMGILFFLSEELVGIVYQRGKFDYHSTQMTATALRMYAIGLPLYSLYKIWVPTFYALDKQRIPVVSSLISIGINILFSVLTVDEYGFSMLALGTTLSMFINCLIQAWYLKKYLDLKWSFFINWRLIKLLLATVSLSLTLHYLSAFYFEVHASVWHRFALATGFVFIGVLSFVFSLVVLKERALVDLVMERVKSRKKR
jgi:putative peptidoglycan lipid II flippase